MAQTRYPTRFQKSRNPIFDNMANLGTLFRSPVATSNTTPIHEATSNSTEDSNIDPSTTNSLLDTVTRHMTAAFDRLEAKLTAKFNNATPSTSQVRSEPHSAIRPTTPTTSAVDQTDGRSPTTQQQSTSRTIPPMGKIIKIDYPKFVGDPASFENWKFRFIATICATELAPLYDRDNHSLVGYDFYTHDANFQQYEVQLYSRLLQALPDSSTFIQSADYVSRGIALWEALLEDNNSTGAVHNTGILFPALPSGGKKTVSSNAHAQIWHFFWRRKT